MSELFQSGFHLGKCAIDPLSGQIKRPDGTGHVTPKAMEILLCFVGRPEELIERDELIQAGWGGGAHHEEALTRCIAELRHALGDHHDHPEYIQTIPRRGYRLVAPVRLPGVNAAAAESSAKGNTQGGSGESFWVELKKRNVVRVALAYTAVSWLLLQVADVVFEALRFPEVALPIFLLVLGLGFLIAVIVAWLFQVVPEHQVEVGRRRKLKVSVDVGIIGVLAIAVGLLAYRQFGSQPFFPEVAALPVDITAPDPAPRSIAVSRFANFGGDKAFSDGLGEQLLNLLARTGDLKVPSRQATWKLSDQNIDPRVIANTLRVRHLLEGSVQQSEQRIRVTAQLIDGSSGDHIWSESYDETLSPSNFFNIQDSIARQVVKKLEATVSMTAGGQLARQGTADDDALRYYLSGREELNRPKTRQTLTAAVADFESAIESDSHYTEAHAGLCEAQLAWYVTYRNVEYFNSAEVACIRAVRLNDDLGEVHAALGSLHRYAGQYDEAEVELLKARQLLNDPSLVLEELARTYRAQNKLVLAEQTFDEAISNDPGNWSVYKSKANFLFRTGRYADALPYYKQVTLMQRDSAVAYTNIGSAFFMMGDFENSTVAWGRSLELEPTHFAYMNVGNSLYYQGRFEESIEMYRNAIELGADDARAWGSLAASCQISPGEEECAADAYERSIELIEKTLSINPLDTNALSRHAAYLARTGDHDEALQILGKLAELNWDHPDVAIFMAHAQVAIGDLDAALSQLKQAVVMGYPRALIAADPGFRRIRNHSDFREFSQIGVN